MPSLNTKLATAPNTSSNYVLKATTSTTIGNSLIFDNGTNVGIGNTNTTYTFDVTGTGRFTGALTAANGSFNMSSAVPSPVGISAWDNTVSLFGGITTTSNALALGYNTTNNASYILSAQPGVAWRTMWFGASDYKFTVGQGSTPSMTITSTGNVGIGTSSPKALFETGNTAGTNIAINSEIAPVISNNAYFSSGWKYRYSSGASYMNLDTSGAIIWANAASGTADATINWTERMRITSGGNVGIGMTNPNARLHVTAINTSSSNFAFALADSAANDLFYVRNDGFINTGSRAASPYNNTSGNAANMVVGADGTIYRSTSSLKYKTDVTDYNKGLDEVLKMRPVYYKSINEREKDLQFAGLIAEEIHDLGLTEFVQYAEDGSPDALAYQNMIALLTKAIQELNQQLQDQQQTINSLINR